SFVERHAGPTIRAAIDGPRFLGPGLVPELAGMRNRVERPAQLPGADVIRADVAGRCGQPLADATADDDGVLVDDAGRRQADGLLAQVAAEIETKINAPFLAERLNRRACRGVQRIDVLISGGKHTAFGAVGPVHDASVWSAAFRVWIE